MITPSYLINWILLIKQLSTIFSFIPIFWVMWQFFLFTLSISPLVQLNSLLNWANYNSKNSKPNGLASPFGKIEVYSHFKSQSILLTWWPDPAPATMLEEPLLMIVVLSFLPPPSFMLPLPHRLRPPSQLMPPRRLRLLLLLLLPLLPSFQARWKDTITRTYKEPPSWF